MQSPIPSPEDCTRRPRVLNSTLMDWLPFRCLCILDQPLGHSFSQSARSQWVQVGILLVRSDYGSTGMIWNCCRHWKQVAAGTEWIMMKNQITNLEHAFSLKVCAEELSAFDGSGVRKTSLTIPVDKWHRRRRPELVNRFSFSSEDWHQSIVEQGKNVKALLSFLLDF